MGDQKVQLKSPAPAPILSRPLKTGASFTLVLPAQRAVYRHWDKEVYLPGEEAELVLEGKGIGAEKLEFVIEKAGGADGDWTTVATVQAKVDGDRAAAKYRFPEAGPEGSLTSADWKRTTARPGDRLGFRVEAEGYEGGRFTVQVEKQAADGSWQGYSRWQGTIDQGKYDGVFVVPRTGSPVRAPEGKIVRLSFEREPEEGGAAWMAARTEGLEGTQLQFVLERVDESGEWVEIGSAVSTVKDGLARNSSAVPLRPEGGDEAAADPIRFAARARTAGEEIVVFVDPSWLSGQEFEVKLERRALDGGSGWEERGTVVEQDGPRP